MAWKAKIQNYQIKFKNKSFRSKSTRRSFKQRLSTTRASLKPSRKMMISLRTWINYMKRLTYQVQKINRIKKRKRSFRSKSSRRSFKQRLSTTRASLKPSRKTMISLQIWVKFISRWNYQLPKWEKIRFWNFRRE